MNGRPEGRVRDHGDGSGVQAATGVTRRTMLRRSVGGAAALAGRAGCWRGAVRVRAQRGRRRL